jgi:hypothetical protein
MPGNKVLGMEEQIQTVMPRKASSPASRMAKEFHRRSAEVLMWLGSLTSAAMPSAPTVATIAGGTAAAVTATLAMPDKVEAKQEFEVAVKDRVSVIEHNSHYNEKGELAYEQMIYYDWCPKANRFQVRAWGLLKNPSQIPARDAKKGTYRSIAFDHHRGADVLRVIEADSFRRTWTQVQENILDPDGKAFNTDPEWSEREFLPDDQRKGLSKFMPRPAPVDYRVFGAKLPQDPQGHAPMAP